MEVRDRDGALLLTARYVIAYCRLVDLAVLPAIASPPPQLRLTHSRTVRGQRIVVIGVPDGSTETVSDGLVSATPGGDEGRLIRVSAQIATGSSGGPVLDLHGDVVGIALVDSAGPHGPNFAVPASAITNAYKSYPQHAALSDIPGGRDTGDAAGVAPALDDSAVAAGIRQADAIVADALWDTAAANPCAQERDTVCLRNMRQRFVPSISGARIYLAAGFASRNSVLWLATAAIALKGGSKLAQAGAYDEAYEWLDQLMKALARDSSGPANVAVQQIRVQASFWYAIADALTLGEPYQHVVSSKDCLARDRFKERIQKGLQALDVGASVALTVANQMRRILLQYALSIDRFTPAIRCDYC